MLPLNDAKTDAQQVKLYRTDHCAKPCANDQYLEALRNAGLFTLPASLTLKSVEGHLFVYEISNGVVDLHPLKQRCELANLIRVQCQVDWRLRVHEVRHRLIDDYGMVLFRNGVGFVRRAGKLLFDRGDFGESPVPRLLIQRDAQNIDVSKFQYRSNVRFAFPLGLRLSHLLTRGSRTAYGSAPPSVHRRALRCPSG